MRLILLPMVLVLSGCMTLLGPSQPLTVDQQMAVTCRGYAVTLNSLALVKDDLTARQIAVVDEAKKIITPLCAAASGQLENFDLSTALGDVRNELRDLMFIQGEIQ